MTEQTGKRDDDSLRAAMDRVRGTHRGRDAHDHERRAPWDVRGRVADDLARVPTPAATTWPRPLAGLVAGAWSAAMSWLVFGAVVLVGWVFAPLGTGGFTDVVRGASAAWIVADGGVVEWQQGRLSLMPLLATVIILLFQRRAGAWLVASVDVIEPRAAVSPLVFAVAASASVHALVVASVMNDALRVPLWRSVAGASLVAVLGFGWGVARSVVITLSDAWRPAYLLAARFLFGMTVVGVALVTVAAFQHWRGFVEVLNALAGDRTSSVQVVLLCLLYVPTMLGWSVAVALGPGFSLGAGTAVSLHALQVGALPPIPLLALVPEALPQGALLVLAAPLLVALWATRGVRTGDLLPVVLPAVGSVAVVGSLLAAAVAGGIGPARLTQVGPVWWQIGVLCGGWLLLGASLRLGTQGLLRRPWSGHFEPPPVP